jgi:hypothetical protein
VVAFALAAFRGRAAFAADGLAAAVRFVTRARVVDFCEVLALFAAVLRFGAARFRPTAFLPAAFLMPAFLTATFLTAARLLVAVFRLALLFLPVLPERCRRARAAFRLAIGTSFHATLATLTVSGK